MHIPSVNWHSTEDKLPLASPRTLYWERDSSMSVGFYFTDVMRKTTWERVLAVLEMLALPTSSALDDFNISNLLNWLPVAVQTDLVTSIESRDCL